MLLFPLLVVILTVKSPCTLTIIARGAPLVLIFVAGHGGCCRIFGIWNNRLLSNPFWKLICVLLGWVTTRDISIWPAVFLDTDLLTTFVTSFIWPGRWTSYRATNIYTAMAIEINLIQSLVYLLLNGHSVYLWKWRLFLIIYFSVIRFPLILIDKITVFLHSLL